MNKCKNCMNFPCDCHGVSEQENEKCKYCGSVTGIHCTFCSPFPFPSPSNETGKEWWEKDFYFDGVTYKGHRHSDDKVKRNYVNMLISQARLQERQTVCEIIEGMRPRKFSDDNTVQSDFSYGYKEALQDLLTKMKK